MTVGVDASHNDPMRPVRVLLFEEQRTFAEALAVRLDAVEDVRVVGIESRAKSVPATVHALRPDILTTDVVNSTGDCWGLVRRVITDFPNTRIVVLASTDHVDAAVRAVWAGVSAWVSKDASTETLLQVLRGVVAGEAHMPAPLLGALFRRVVASGIPEPIGDARLRSLTPRESEVLQCMMIGLNRAATADKLALSPNTVRTHVQSILAKLGAHTSLEAVSIAVAAGLPAAND